MREVFGDDLPASGVFRNRVVDWLGRLAAQGTVRTLEGTFADEA